MPIIFLMIITSKIIVTLLFSISLFVICRFQLFRSYYSFVEQRFLHSVFYHIINSSQSDYFHYQGTNNYYPTILHACILSSQQQVFRRLARVCSQNPNNPLLHISYFCILSYSSSNSDLQEIKNLPSTGSKCWPRDSSIIANALSYPILSL